jgi:hypothetical protein
VPIRNSLRRPIRSITNQDVVAKIAYTTMFTPPNSRAKLCVVPSASWNKTGK